MLQPKPKFNPNQPFKTVSEAKPKFNPDLPFDELKKKDSSESNIPQQQKTGTTASPLAGGSLATQKPTEEEDYFTEKLLDCLLTGTIPVYLGCPAIEKYFNTTSILRFKDPEQLPEILSTLTPELYLSMLDSVIENFEKAKQYIHPEHLIQKCIETL
jgi:hypothetical protein